MKGVNHMENTMPSVEETEFEDTFVEVKAAIEVLQHRQVQAGPKADLALDWTEQMELPGCYAIFQRDECLYVGSGLHSVYRLSMAAGTRVAARVAQLKNVKYRYYLVRQTEDVQDVVRELETELLQHYQPKWNRNRVSTLSSLRGRKCKEEAKEVAERRASKPTPEPSPVERLISELKADEPKDFGGLEHERRPVWGKAGDTPFSEEYFL